MSRFLLPILLLLVMGSACIRRSARPPLGEPPRLALTDIHYDGRSLSGLVLIGARAPTLLDRRLVEDVAVGISSLRDSETGEEFSPWVADSALPDASEEDLLTLRPGEWLGREVSFLLFADPLGTVVGPHCITFELFLVLPEAGVQGPAATTTGQACKEADETPIPAQPASPQPESGRKSDKSVLEDKEGRSPSFRLSETSLLVVPAPLADAGGEGLTNHREGNAGGNVDGDQARQVAPLGIAPQLLQLGCTPRTPGTPHERGCGRCCGQRDSAPGGSAALPPRLPPQEWRTRCLPTRGRAQRKEYCLPGSARLFHQEPIAVLSPRAGIRPHPAPVER